MAAGAANFAANARHICQQKKHERCGGARLSKSREICGHSSAAIVERGWCLGAALIIGNLGNGATWLVKSGEEISDFHSLVVINSSAATHQQSW